MVARCPAGDRAASSPVGTRASPDEGVHMSRATRALVLLTAIGVGAVGAVVPFAPAAAAATSIALVGDLQSELGCPGDWQPECAATELTDDGDGTWSAEFDVPAGSWQYKVAYNDAWDESYGREGGGDNAPLTIAGDTLLRFTFDEATHLTAVTPVDLTGGYTSADDSLVAAPVREAGAGQQFYFVMTDRFANGDTVQRHRRASPADRLVSGFDPTDKGFYHGGDLAGLRSHLDYIQGLGTTAIWLTPVVHQQARAGHAERTPRPATTATGSPTSPRSTRTWAPTPTCRR